jgi:hypothetical protein
VDVREPADGGRDEELAEGEERAWEWRTSGEDVRTPWMTSFALIVMIVFGGHTEQTAQEDDVGF